MPESTHHDIVLKLVVGPKNPFDDYPVLRSIWPGERSAHAEADTVKDLALGVTGDPHRNRVYLVANHGEIVGITGFFMPCADVDTQMGLRWHGIAPAQRGKGYSEQAVDAVCELAVVYHPNAKEIVEYVPMADRANGERLVAYFGALGFVADATAKNAMEWPAGLSLPPGSGEWLAMRRPLTTARSAIFGSNAFSNK